MSFALQPRKLAVAIWHSCLLLGLAMPVLAQSSEEADDESTESQAQQLDVVTVTGSRIPRAGYDTLEPAISVSREEIDRRGLTNVADALNEIPGFGVGVTPEGGQASFGAGVNFVNRFGLGSNRTLTLVNGRRFVSSNPVTIFGPTAPGLQVDLNAIPTQLVERVDNLTVGGAPTYGADAIAGTVNLILRQDFEGFEFGTTMGITERGDNERFNGRLLWGKNFADGRGNVVLAVSGDSVAGVLADDRDLFSRGRFFGTNPTSAAAALFPGRTPQNDGRLNPNTPFNNGATDGVPAAVYVANRRLNPLTFGGLLFPATGGTANAAGLPVGFGPGGETRLQFDTNGNLVPFTPGVPFGSLDAFGGDGLDLNETGQVTSDLERANAYSAGHFEFADGVRGYFEALYFKSKGTELIDQPIYNATVFGGLSQPLTFSATDPRLTAQARARLAELGVTSFRLSRASRDLVENNSSTETDIYRGVLGLTWDFNAFGRDLSWDNSFTYGRSDADNFQTVLNQQNFVNAMNVTTNAAGQIVCAGTGTIGVFGGSPSPRPDANCVPLDIFGEGRASAAARDYVTGRTRANSLLKQTVFNSNLGGTLFDYWAGSLGFNIGYEFRKEEGQFTPDAFQVAGLGRAVPIGANGGEFETDEFFAEFNVPLIAPENGIFGVHSLSFEAKGRRVDNSINGEFDAYTAGFQWSPIADLRIRGNNTRSLRSPAITELFTPASSAFSFLNDPCDPRFINAPSRPGGARAANCAALFSRLGINPSTFQSTIVSASQQIETGGDPNLRNEDADSSTIGFVWEPAFVPGLSLAVDYIEIDIRDAIQSLTATQIANACYDAQDFNSGDPLNGNAFCSRINRNAEGQIVAVINADGSTTPAVRTGFANVADLNFRGVTADLRYSFEVGDGWLINLGATAFNLRELKTEVLGSPDFADGEIGNSTRQYRFLAGVTKGPVNVNVQANYQSSAVFDRTFILANDPLGRDPTRDVDGVKGYDVYDLGINYQLTENGVVRFSVTNLFDSEPPFGVIGIGAYDILGRRYALATEWRF